MQDLKINSKTYWYHRFKYFAKNIYTKTVRFFNLDCNEKSSASGGMKYI